MAVVISKRGGGAARIRDRLHGVVREIAVSHRALLGRGARLQPPKPIVQKRSQLPGLIDLADLVAGVVRVGGRGINALVPIQLLHLLQSAEHVHGRASATATLVARCDNFTARTAATAICILARAAVGKSREKRTALPVIALIRPNPAGRIVSRRSPASGNLGWVSLLPFIFCWSSSSFSQTGFLWPQSLPWLAYVAPALLR